MAEAVGLVASIVGITSFAVQLTQKLYEVGATTSTARQQINRLSRNIGLYRTVLDLLADELSDNEPIYSQKALDFAALLRDDSNDFFQTIERLLAVRRGEHNNISVLNKITWSFKKSKVDSIIIELDRLKATVQLFVGVLALGHEYKAYRRQKSSPKRVEATKTAFTNVQNMLVEYADTTELAAMERDKAQQEVEDDEEQWAALGNDHHYAQPSTALVRVIPSSLILLKDSSGISFEAYEGDMAQNLRTSPNYALRLLREWTVLPAADDRDEQDPLVMLGEAPKLLTDKAQRIPRGILKNVKPRDKRSIEAPRAREYSDLLEDVPDIVLLDSAKGRVRLPFTAFSISDKLLRVSDLQRRAAEELGEDDYRKVRLTYKDTLLAEEGRPVAEYGVKQYSTVRCEINRKPPENGGCEIKRKALEDGEKRARKSQKDPVVFKDPRLLKFLGVITS
jgi:hypothetical protein